MEKVRETGESDGMIYKGKYGEGKTHLLNTVFNMASSSNMVVSYVALERKHLLISCISSIRKLLRILIFPVLFNLVTGRSLQS